jgi:hypothetical protein
MIIILIIKSYQATSRPSLPATGATKPPDSMTGKPRREDVLIDGALEAYRDRAPGIGISMFFLVLGPLAVALVRPDRVVSLVLGRGAQRRRG